MKHWTFGQSSSVYLHEHLDKSRCHDRCHGDNQDRPSTTELEQECQERDLQKNMSKRVYLHIVQIVFFFLIF